MFISKTTTLMAVCAALLVAQYGSVEAASSPYNPSTSDGNSYFVPVSSYLPTNDDHGNVYLPGGSPKTPDNKTTAPKGGETAPSGGSNPDSKTPATKKDEEKPDAKKPSTTTPDNKKEEENTTPKGVKRTIWYSNPDSKTPATTPDSKKEDEKPSSTAPDSKKEEQDTKKPDSSTPSNTPNTPNTPADNQTTPNDSKNAGGSKDDTGKAPAPSTTSPGDNKPITEAPANNVPISDYESPDSYVGNNPKGICQGKRIHKLVKASDRITLTFNVPKAYPGDCKLYIMDENYSNSQWIATKPNCGVRTGTIPWTVDIPSNVTGKKVLRWVWDAKRPDGNICHVEMCHDIQIKHKKKSVKDDAYSPYKPDGKKNKDDKKKKKSPYGSEDDDGSSDSSSNDSSNDSKSSSKSKPYSQGSRNGGSDRHKNANAYPHRF
ncbi:hypothetical protein BDF22DRAFT_78682 [Syncephalis plumigaleata]|nr:hypothetical protein BDF22DRAFT_78682 [Syncephalis plumigaleata]